ncbi:LysR family transcriptional regulator [Paralcaligenes ureilyticus]|uniref:LysR family transcriptional regulator n=1 Tax=Paralcaligenes ureilyticus TaxID=627131 RepID=A0A4R3M6P3_9BURK|nr:LysR substrate-binding domain-containing protein [Paralcaligenes ureilyticus]TCT08990.1 LysR family transcriptional regulator [Paralcaligenes ureilyticus]
MLNLKQLRYFLAVAEEEHYGRAANRLGISQPPLTEHIQALEQDLQAQLFRRTTRSVQLTNEGKALMEHVRTILLDIDRCRAVVADAKYERATLLTLGVLHAHTYTFLPGFLKHCFDKIPDVRIKLVEYSTQQQAATLVDGGVNIGIVREPVYHPDLETVSLFQERYCIALPTSSPQARKKKISIKDLINLPMIGYPSHDNKRSTRNLFRDFFAQFGVTPAGYEEVTTTYSALALVAAGRGFSPVPESQTLMKINGVSYRNFSEEAPRLSVGLAWLRGQNLPILDQFTALARNYFSHSRRATPQENNHIHK